MPKATAFLASLLVVTAMPSLAAETGLYDFSDPEHPKLLYDALESASIVSLSSDDHLSLLSVRAASGFTIPCSQIRLIVGEKTIRFQSRDVAFNSCTLMEAQIDD